MYEFGAPPQGSQVDAVPLFEPMPVSHEIQAGPSALALMGLVLAILSFAMCGPFMAIPAIVMCKIEMDNINRRRSSRAGEWLVKIGAIVGLSNVALFGTFFAVYGLMLAGIVTGAALAPPPAHESSARLVELETHLQTGEEYAEGPDAQRIAQAVRASVQPGDGIAVRVIGGAPRRVIVLVRRERVIGNERLPELERIMASIDTAYDASADELGIGLRYQGSYDAIAIRRGGTQGSYTQWNASEAQIATMLSQSSY